MLLSYQQPALLKTCFSLIIKANEVVFQLIAEIICCSKQLDRLSLDDSDGNYTAVQRHQQYSGAI
jgi:hypothetical protein